MQTSQWRVKTIPNLLACRIRFETLKALVDPRLMPTSRCGVKTISNLVASRLRFETLKAPVRPQAHANVSMASENYIKLTSL